MKATYIKRTITSLVLVTAMALPMTAMAAETAKSTSNGHYERAPVTLTLAEKNAVVTGAVNGMGSLTEAERQEFDDACSRLETLEAELDRLIQNDEYGTACEQIENQMAPLRVRIVELGSKAFSDDAGETADTASPDGYADELNLTEAEKQELTDALRKLDELQTAADAGEDVESQMAVLEARVVELENRAFPDDGEDLTDPASHRDYADSLNLTDAEREELIAALQAQDDQKIATLELKAFANDVMRQADGESQEYQDAAREIGELVAEMLRLMDGGVSDGQLEQLNELDQKVEALCDVMEALSAKA